MVDSDTATFTVEGLRKWKEAAEEESFRDVLSGSTSAIPIEIANGPESDVQEIVRQLGLSPSDDLEAVASRLMIAAREDLAAFMRVQTWTQQAVALDLIISEGGNTQLFDASRLAVAIEAFNEITVVAGPGTGKTTTLLQTTDAILSRGEIIPVFVPLAEWTSQPIGLLPSITRRHAFRGMQEAHLRLLAHSGRLAVVMDGWNEVDPASRKRARTEIQQLQREFPELVLLLSTRRQAMDVPVSGPVIEIAPLTEAKQLEIARALRGSEGEAILDHAWRTSGIRDLVSVPLYLTSLITVSPGESLPTTKEEVLRLFVEKNENAPERAEALSAVLFGCHADMLRALAVVMTETGNTSLPETTARALVKNTGERLASEGQISTIPQPAAVLDVLVNHHLLIRSGGGGASAAINP